MKIICTICARKGSKGIKNKNLLKIKNNLNLIDYTLKQALKVKEINKILVSSDIKNLKTIKNKKIFYLNRPRKLSGDKIGKLDVIRHAVKFSEEHFKINFGYIIDLDVTSPLRTVNDIKKAIQIFKKKKSNNLITFCKSRKNPYFNMIERKKNKFKLIKNVKKIFLRRQDAPKAYEMNASIYIWKKKFLFSSNSLFSNKTIGYEMPYERSIDIDSLSDYKIVKKLISKK